MSDVYLAFEHLQIASAHMGIAREYYPDDRPEREQFVEILKMMEELSDDLGNMIGDE